MSEIPVPISIDFIILKDDEELVARQQQHPTYPIIKFNRLADGSIFVLYGTYTKPHGSGLFLYKDGYTNEQLQKLQHDHPNLMIADVIIRKDGLVAITGLLSEPQE